MRVIVTGNFDQTCEIAAGMIAETVQNKPDARLGLATGGTAQGVYPYLISAYKNGTLDFSRVDTINLDEYIGLAPDHPQSYRRFMNENFFHHINIDLKRTVVAKGSGDIETNLREFRLALAKKPIDIQLLGIGINGHIGFNEPGEVLIGGAHIETLNQSTIDANVRFFATRDEVPACAISMGIGDILRAGKLLLLATGENKAQAMKQLLLTEEISTQNPATFVKTHSDVTIIIDRELANAIGYQY